MLTIQKSISRELLTNIFLSIFFLNTVLIIEKLLKISKIFASVGLDLQNLILLILLLQPQILVFTVPMALLLSTLITYGRIQSDNEMTILLISGMSYKRTFKPALLIGIFCFFLTLFMSFYLAPLGISHVREKITQILAERAPLGIEEGIFNQGFRGITIFVKEKPEKTYLKGIVIFDERKEDTKIVLAKEGRITIDKDNINLSLIDGKAYFSKGNIMNEIIFKEYTFKVSPYIEPIAKKIGENSFNELINLIKTDQKKKIDYKIELYRRFLLPALCLVGVFLSPSLCKIVGRTGRLGGITLGFLLFAVYYVLSIYGINLAKAGRVSPELGSLMPFLIVGFLALLSYIKLKN